MSPRHAAIATATALLVVWLAGCGGGPDTKPLVTSGRFVGSTVCAGCHGVAKTQSRNANGGPEGAFDEWLQTGHAHAFQTLKDIGQHENPACTPCHTVGYGQESGFVSEQETPHLINVGCESCHGSGAEHASDPTANPAAVPLSAEVCGDCHSGFHHPTAEQWSTSGHAEALETIQNHPYGQDSCLECHSVDVFLHEFLPGDPPVLRQANVAQEPITCVLCHDPHSEEYEGQLRTEPAELCIRCHTTGDTLPGEDPHHPQREIFLGEGGVDANGDPLTGPNSPHTNAAALRCIQCHVSEEHPP
ncbi:MAG: multiheme c-type cytochrome, partial [Armatimonadota bacterium]